MKNIIIVGAGGLGREMLALLKNINTTQPQWKVLGFVDDGKTIGDVVNGVEVLGGVEYLNTLSTETAAIIAISLPKIRKVIFDKITNTNIFFPSIIHPSAIISDIDFVDMGKGCILCINTVLTTNIVLGDFVLINAGAILNHDAQIGSFSTIMPGVNISTGAQISKGCYIGTGSKISKPAVISAWENLPAGTIIA